MVVIVLMGTQEVVVGNPEGEVIVGAFDAVESVCFPVRGFVGTVEPFDHLLERTVFCGYSIVVGKSDDLGDGELKSITELMEELLGSQGISAVSVSDEAEVFRELFEVAEGHAHGKDTGTNVTAVRDAVAEDGAVCSVHDEPDEGLDAADLDISLISGEGTACGIIVVVYERLDTEGSGSAVVGDLLVGDGDAIEILEGAGSFAQGEGQVDMEGKAQGHDVGVKFTEPEGGSIFREGVQVHAEKIHRELTVDVVELIFIFTEVLFEVLLIHFLKVAEIVRAFGIHALVKDEVFPVFLWDKGMSAVGAAQGILPGETVFPWGEGSGADLAGELASLAVVAVKVGLGRIAGRASAIFWDVTFCVACNGPDLLMVFILEVRDEELPVPIVLEELDPGEFIRCVFVVLRGMGIIKSPLFKRDKSADKVN